MKNRIITSALLCALCVAAFSGLAQTTNTSTAPVSAISASSITALLNDGIIKVGQPFSIKGVTVLVNTNADGVFVITVNTPNGDVTVTPPTTTSEALERAQAMIAANNPTNKDYYGEKELVGRVGAVYLQNSGQAVVEIGVEKYGLLKAAPQLGLGAALFQGNNQGKPGTAGACGFLDYRKIIGDCSAQIGIGGGYDNWNSSAMGVVKVDVELRQNKHIGEFVGVGYAIEADTFKSGNADNKGGLMVRGGINYAF